MKLKREGVAVVGIDPGQSGAIFIGNLRKNGNLVYIGSCLMPVSSLGKKRNIDVHRIADIMRDLNSWSNVYTFIEQVHAMPGQGVTSMFNFGRGFGSIEGVLAGLSLPLYYVTPQAWYKQLSKITIPNKGSGSKKDLVAAFVRAHGPKELDLEKKKNYGLADAYMIARYGARLIHDGKIN